jgi:hypothetical protein
MDARRALILLAYAALAAVAGVIGAFVLGLAGMGLYQLIIPARHNCGEIGCWDEFIGAFWGGAIGFIGGCWAGWRLGRARRQAALDLSVAENQRS